MKLGIIIYSNDAETVWNAFRLGVFSLKQGDQVKLFLLGKGVEAEKLDSGSFVVSEQMELFAEGGGELLACGTCLKLRHQEGETVCPLSTMADLYRLIAECDRSVSF